MQEAKNTEHTFQDDRITQFKDRLREAMKGKTNVGLARMSNMSEAAIRDYISGKTYPSLDRLAVIAKNLDVSIEWLATGSTNTSTQQAGIQSEPKAVITPEQQKAWLDILERMTPEEAQQAINNINRNGLRILLDSES